MTPLQILTPEGSLVAESPLADAAVKRLYEAMVVSRVYDRKCSAMQRQGRLATYAPFEGQEAAQIGSGSYVWRACRTVATIGWWRPTEMRPRCGSTATRW